MGNLLNKKYKLKKEVKKGIRIFFDTSLVALLAVGGIHANNTNKKLIYAKDVLKKQNNDIEFMRNYIDDLESNILTYQSEIYNLKESNSTLQDDYNENELEYVNENAMVHVPYNSSYDIKGFIEKNGYNIDSDYFVSLCEKYDIDGAFALSTWGLETRWGKSKAWINANNPAGIICTYGECYGEYQVYPSQKDGLVAMFDLIKYYNNELGRKTIKDIRGLWSVADDNQIIVNIMNEIIDFTKGV